MKKYMVKLKRRRFTDSAWFESYDLQLDYVRNSYKKRNLLSLIDIAESKVYVLEANRRKLSIDVYWITVNEDTLIRLLMTDNFFDYVEYDVFRKTYNKKLYDRLRNIKISQQQIKHVKGSTYIELDNMVLFI